MTMRVQLGVNLVVVHPQAHLFRRPRRYRHQEQENDGQRNKGPTLAPRLNLHVGRLSWNRQLFSKMRIVTQKMLSAQGLALIHSLMPVVQSGAFNRQSSKTACAALSGGCPGPKFSPSRRDLTLAKPSIILSRAGP